MNQEPAADQRFKGADHIPRQALETFDRHVHGLHVQAGRQAGHRRVLRQLRSQVGTTASTHMLSSNCFPKVHAVIAKSAHCNAMLRSNMCGRCRRHHRLHESKSAPGRQELANGVYVVFSATAIAQLHRSLFDTSGWDRGGCCITVPPHCKQSSSACQHTQPASGCRCTNSCKLGSALGKLHRRQFYLRQFTNAKL